MLQAVIEYLLHARAKEVPLRYGQIGSSIVKTIRAALRQPKRSVPGTNHYTLAGLELQLKRKEKDMHAFEKQLQQFKFGEDSVCLIGSGIKEGELLLQYLARTNEAPQLFLDQKVDGNENNAYSMRSHIARWCACTA